MKYADLYIHRVCFLKLCSVFYWAICAQQEIHAKENNMKFTLEHHVKNCTRNLLVLFWHEIHMNFVCKTACVRHVAFTKKYIYVMMYQVILTLKMSNHQRPYYSEEWQKKSICLSHFNTTFSWSCMIFSQPVQYKFYNNYQFYINTSSTQWINYEHTCINEINIAQTLSQC